MTQPILAAVDLSHPKDNAGVLKEAERLAAFHGTLLVVVTVLPDFRSSFVGSFFPEDHMHKMTDEARTKLHAFVNETLGHDKDVQHVVRVGTVYEEILATARDMDVATIVVGAHRRELPQYLIGPHAARVARHATCSVYIYRDD
ncbi:MAG: universal stress protein [Pseudomonadota bacterium]